MAELDRKTRRKLEEKKKREQVKKTAVIVLLAAVLLGLCIAAGIFAFPRVCGKIVFRGTTELSLRDAGRSELGEVYLLPRLRSLDLRGNTVSEETYLQMQQHYPDCSILWDAPIAGTTADSSSQMLEFTDIPADFANVKYFPDLKEIVILQPADQDAMLQLKDSYPQYQFSWSVLMNGEWYAPDTKELTLKDSEFIYTEITENVKYFQKLEKLTVEGTRLSMRQQLLLKEQFPNLDFVWNVIVWGTAFPSDAQTITLEMKADSDLEAIGQAVSLLGQLNTIELSGEPLTLTLQRQLRETYPGLTFRWQVRVWGSEFSGDAETITLTMDEQRDMQELDDAIHVLPNLTSVQMSGSLLSLSRQRQLRESYPGLNFIWTVTVWKQSFASDAESIVLSAESMLNQKQFDDAIHVFTNLKTVTITGRLLTTSIQRQLRETYPELNFDWTVTVWGREQPQNAETITLTADTAPDLTEFADAVALLDNLKGVTITGSQLTPAIQKQMLADYPQLSFVWPVTVWGQEQPQHAETISLSADTVLDLAEFNDALCVFTGLKTVEIRGILLTPTIQKQMLADYPQLSFVWPVTVWGQEYPLNAESITLTSELPPDFQELEDALCVFTGVKQITMGGKGITTTDQRRMMETHSEITFFFTVTLGVDSFPQDTESITLSPESTVSLQEMEDSLYIFRGLKKVDFTNSGVHGSVRIAFQKNHPELDVSWRVFIMGTEYPIDTKTLNFNNMPLSSEDVESIRAGAAQLPELTTVEMCDCGVSNEVMDQMNQENEQVRFIWTVYFANYYLRTDAKYFMPAQWENGATLFDRNSRELKYCVDLECLDLGHSCVEDYSFLQYMPHMKYLILVDSSVLTLEYVGCLKELVFLETFCTYVKDLSPLLGCTALEDLNIGYTRCNGDEAFEVLKQMTWLKRLWYCGTPMSREQIVELRTLLPDTEQYIRTGGQSTGSTWRLGQNYYDMRDLLGMNYMPGGTIGGNWEGWQVVEDDYGTRFVLAYWSGDQKWWEEDPFCYWDWHIYGINCELP